MRTLARAAVTAAMVVGAMAATGTAAVAAESSTSTRVDATTSAAAVDWYYGYGSGTTASSAAWNAKYQAEIWAQIDGYIPIIDCFVVSSYTNKITDTYYTANVTLICY
ncbi:MULTISPECIES: hypothetical protein [unclassified Solwaraspora]|uniref:hypothetical protein n=1 Tax=unclassified Solwaraspora TaxID=2627926 RepID=UPI00259B1997|nr:hypothetical protein [Solwaraspora sp. WMMA2056]WJK40940.1 hypothetical protein O7608_00275 [Solwaraspora sp. WMMA2056]